MKIVEALRKKNRTLLEMQTGILFVGIVCQAVGAFFVERQVYYAKSLWFGIFMAIAASVHMYRTLDRGLDCGADASKIIFRGYLFRYAFLVFVLAVVMVTEVMNPLVVFMGYMSLKVAAFLQPFTHKLCNGFFHETDPVPAPLPEEGASGGEQASREVSEESL
ncbi:MAG: ATP synthase subunit I [Lachnospiraceae bacterium]|nr:ATP synthase subunit I [Lachnospiraceae bacterium]